MGSLHMRTLARVLSLTLLGVGAAAAGCGDNNNSTDGGTHGDAHAGSDAGSGSATGMDRPAGTPTTNPNPQTLGNATAGQTVFRKETFGNEGFWTDAARLPAGIVAAKFTPLDALAAGYQINIDAIDATTKATLAAELQTDLTPAHAPNLNNVATTVKLINENAVIGVVAVDSNGNGTIDIAAGDKVGVACAFCHAITDGSTFAMPNGGSIGHEIDGPTPHFLNVGATFAVAANTRALYPLAELKLAANGNKVLGRSATGLTALSTEAQFDAYFKNPTSYPIGMFDDSFDGNGDPMHIVPMFRQDLAAPYGSEGTFLKLDDFSNLVYTALLDPTTLTTPGGRDFLHFLGGAAGDEIADTYVTVLAATGVTGYPFVTTATTGPTRTLPTPIGVRVDNTKLLDMNAYLAGLQAPVGSTTENAAAVARGRAKFRTDCTTCHDVDQSRFVPPAVLAMARVWPGDMPVTLAQRTPPLTPVLDTVDGTFDDKMAVVNASIRGDIRGVALPLLLDLARKPVFLHDNSVPSLDNLLDSARGAMAPHPFYLSGADRADMIAFLKSLDTSPQ